MDYLQGNAGNDTIDGGAGNDRVYGGANDDSLLGGDGNDHLQGNRGNDFISGGNGNDVVHGGADNDVVHGDAGNDQLFGDAGNDTLVGGAGIDVLAGGPGSDTFVFNARDAAFLTTGSSAWATDEITDFSHGLDTIGLDFHPVQVLSGSAASMDAALTLANSLVGAHSGDADVAAVTVGNDTYLFWDAAGQGGTIDSAVKIDHVHDTFTLSDFG
jgi:Ca2+-binding RTX toxin-like protein